MCNITLQLLIVLFLFSFGQSFPQESELLLTEELVQIWDGSDWVDGFKHIYTYDESGNRVEYVGQLWNDYDWVNRWRWVYTYDNTGNLIKELFQNWGSTDWVNRWNRVFLYDNSNLTGWISQNWGNSEWIMAIKWTFIYDGNNSVQELRQNWGDSEWANYWMWTFNFDNADNKTERLWQSWGGYWINRSKTLYSYTNLTGIEQPVNIKVYDLSNNYPNPFNPTTTISYSVPEIGFVTLIVYDVLGNMVVILVNEEKSSGIYEIKWDASYASSGIYFYRLKTGNFIKTKKMVLLK